MKKEFNLFEDNIKRIRELDNLYVQLKDVQKVPNDISDILRAEWVYLVSALDKLVHDLIRMGMIETFKEERLPTRTYKGFSLSLETMENIRKMMIERLKNPTYEPTQEEMPEYWFEKQIILSLKNEVYQDADKIGNGLSLIWNEEHKWQKIAKHMGRDEKAIKIQLKLLKDRRNQIVHEADINPETQEVREMEHKDIADFIDFIHKLGSAIYECVKK